MNYPRTKHAFTMVELLVVVLIIGVLAAIASANFVGVQAKSKTAAVKGLMHCVQVAAEAYSVDSGGHYSSSVVQLINYAPGGSNSLAAGTAGNWPPNPVDSTVASVITGGSYTDAAAIIAARSTTGSGTPGQAEYAGTTDLMSYGIKGYNSDGTQVLDNAGGHSLVLSNQ